ncbi:HD-GYP domain-containing protein [Alteromonas oceanisediminis]|uniref:HD-GYP domain-containing protein n=1 Tax=Alteromonas oceanisediminis TaxID=2836180 RepID=UPI001BDA3CEA|nr:HD domain-containing phosphohydrolase [Alteromonas oceanisediminis]MBT0585090.1 DUF3391 domain-containing protein [Alteromonas oceanisediminis]
MLKEISIAELVPGMYVNQVLKQSGKLKMRSKGLVKTQATIEQLKQKGIELLEIDITKSQVDTSAKSSSTPQSSLRDRRAPSKPAEQSNSDMLSAANDLYLNAVMIQGEFVDQLQKGSGADIEKVTQVSQGIIDAIFDNTNAITCLTLIKNADEYLLEHSVSCAILMGLFARHMEFDKALIEDLSLGALLMDVGMATVPADVFQKNGQLSKQDWQLMKGHVEAGLEMLEPIAELSDVTRDVIQNHHERMDGSGYPVGKQGQSISTYARMAAIIDSYDAMVSDRKHQQGQTPTGVLRKLLTDTTLDQTLVQQFIKCIGVHPVGSLVKLKSEKLALVSSAGKTDPLSPVVMAFYSLRTQAHTEIKRIDLAKSDDEIMASVRPNEFKMNLTKFFREVFIHQVP